MFRNWRVSSILYNASIIIAIIAGGFLQPPLVEAKSYPAEMTQEEAETGEASPSSYLNLDGTLNLDGNFSGSFDLQGWDVQMDPMLGPVFQPTDAPSTLALGQWASLGGGVPASPNANVRAIAISGTDVYVGGTFTNLNNNDSLDFVAKWNGTSWSALGSNGSGDGSLSGLVDKIVINGTDVYVAGSFSNVNNNGTVLGAADYIAKWNGTNWSALGSNGFGDGSINAQINALAVSGSNVYVGGQFTDVKNSGFILTSADYVAKWDGANWSALGSNGAGNGSLTSAQVYAIAISGSNVYVGGQFTNVNNNGTVLNAADYIAKWDGTNWSALSSNGSGDGSLTNHVRAVGVSGSNVYVGGPFTDVNNNGTVLGAADYIAKWDGTNWSALGSNGSGGGSLTSQVLGITVSGSNVYVGGIFGNVNNNGTVLGAADYIAKWDGTNWSALGSNGAGDGSLNYYLSAIAVSGSNVYIGGLFTNVNNNGTSTGLTYLALFNGTDWGPVDTSLQGAVQSHVTTVAANGTNVYVGGSFTNAAGIPEADYIAKWDGTNWSALSSNGSGDGALSNAYVTDIAISGTDVYVGGTFGYVNDNGNFLNAADNIAKWDGTNWSALGSNGAGDGSISTNVHTVTVSGSNVYVGGLFENVNNNGTVLGAADYLAKWDGTNWSALGSNGAGDGALGFWVDGIAVNGSDVYVIGAFTNVNNNGTVLGAADYIAKWDGTNWSALSSNGAGDGSFNGSINSIAISGSNVYVGGNFAYVNDNGVFVPSSGYIAKWNGTNWSALGSNGAGGSSLNGQVNAIAISGTDIYAGGQFVNVNNNGTVLMAADYIAKWDGSNWSALGSNGAANGAIPSSPSTQVRALDVEDDSLYVGGSFFNVNNSGTPLPYADYIAAYGIPSSEATINITIGGTNMGSYTLDLGSSTRQSFNGINAGPVNLDNDTADIIAAERVIYNVNGVNTSFSETMALPDDQLDTTYWLPWYNNVDLDTQLRFGNVSGQPASVHVYIGGVEMTGSPFALTATGAGQSTRLSFAGVNAGPVQIVSNVDIVAAERVIYTVNGTATSFSEMMALPNDQLDTTYWLPWYNNVDLDTQLRIGNVSGQPASVHVYIGGVEMTGSPFALTASGAGQSTRLSFAGVNAGPVQIVSNVSIVAAERVIYTVNGTATSFSETMALSQDQLGSTYWLPWYNNVDLDTQLRIGNVSGQDASVHVYIGGVEMTGSPFALTSSGAGQSTRVSFAGVNAGPVQIVSNVSIVAAERVIYTVNGVATSFSEMMGLSNSLLDAGYWTPWYNNVDLDTQLRFAVP
jgi:hypothetical protein